MKYYSHLISKYLVRAVLPYFFLSWILLSVILFVQQAGRYSDIFFNVNIPDKLIWQLTLALIPNVIAFTCPMAVLVGVIIGLSRMQGDSELVSIKASGVGNLQILLPIIMIGLVLSGFAFLVNLVGVPFAAKIVRRVALQTALYKLESPIEPGVFNSEITNFTIYVKRGDLRRGFWRNIFVHSSDPENGRVRLITSKSGRIDSDREFSELVLEDAVVTTLSKNNTGKKIISENVGEIRFRVNTKRDELVRKISKTELAPEELGLNELAAYSKQLHGREKTEAEILWYRRLVLSITPLIFALLGTALVLRYNRGGKGFGVFLALISLVSYYLLTLISEQLARTNTLSVFWAAFLPILVGLAAVVWFFKTGHGGRGSLLRNINGWTKNFLSTNRRKMAGSSFYIDWTTGLLDLDIVVNLLKYFLLTFSFLTTVYLVFTAFELWKFAGNFDGGPALLARYLLYLLPFIYIQLAPSALMIAVLATYVIKSRRNEIVTWTASGQSIFRLLLPCFVLMIFFGIINFGIGEYISPGANRIQDRLRNLIRSRGVLPEEKGRRWVAEKNRIYSFDTERKSSPQAPGKQVRDLWIYDFAGDGIRLKNVYQIPEAVWKNGHIIPVAKGSVLFRFERPDIKREVLINEKITASNNPFQILPEKPSHLSIGEIRTRIRQSDSELERRTYRFALHKKYTTLVLPLVITLFTAPFALTLSRKSKVLTIGYAVGLWLIYMGITSTFEQFGLNGFLSPGGAVWFPLVLFTIIGVYLLTRIKS